MLKKLAIALTVMVSVPAFAATQTWTGLTAFGADTTSYNLSSGGVNLTIRAWSDTDGSNDDIVRDALLHDAGLGLGALNDDEINFDGTGSPNHSIDSISNSTNNWTDTDMISLEFNQAVNLASVWLGWTRDSETDGFSDSSVVDMSFGAFDGPVSALNGKTWSDIVDDVLTFESSQANVAKGSYQSVTSAAGTYAKVWLIGAYNPLFSALSGQGSGNDGLKLKKFTTRTRNGGEVPVPGTLLLILAGMLALYTYRNSSWDSHNTIRA